MPYLDFLRFSAVLTVARGKTAEPPQGGLGKGAHDCGVPPGLLLTIESDEVHFLFGVVVDLPLHAGGDPEASAKRFSGSDEKVMANAQVTRVCARQHVSERKGLGTHADGVVGDVD